MCLRPPVEETNENIDQSARTGKGCCKAGKCRGWLTSSGQTEHPGQTCPNIKEKHLDTGVKKGGKCEKAQKAAKNAPEEELIAEMYEIIL